MKRDVVRNHDLLRRYVVDSVVEVVLGETQENSFGADGGKFGGSKFLSSMNEGLASKNLEVFKSRSSVVPQLERCSVFRESCRR